VSTVSLRHAAPATADFIERLARVMVAMYRTGDFDQLR
jgi:hypothetical protein